MNLTLLDKHIRHFLEEIRKDPDTYAKERQERADLVAYFSTIGQDRLLKFTAEELYSYVSQLWAMRIWGNKRYVIDKLIADNGLTTIRSQLSNLVWGADSLEGRWNEFRTGIKGMGPAMMSELLCKSHPRECMLWNRRAYVALRYLEVSDLPRYDYQLTGAVYRSLCTIAQSISERLHVLGVQDTSLLAVDYFVWQELQVEPNLTRMHETKEESKPINLPSDLPSAFVHNDIRDKVRDIGQWLGFDATIEAKVSDGSRVDAVWEATIGNMGRIIYVFEVQTKGSIDSLILNLLKSLNNPAVQGVVAVSDAAQIERIRRHVKDVKDLSYKLRYWDYDEVMRVHESLEFVNSAINSLGLVPDSF